MILGINTFIDLPKIPGVGFESKNKMGSVKSGACVLCGSIL